MHAVLFTCGRGSRVGGSWCTGLSRFMCGRPLLVRAGVLDINWCSASVQRMFACVVDCWLVAWWPASAAQVDKRSMRLLTSTRRKETASSVGPVSSSCYYCEGSNISSLITKSSRTWTLIGMFSQRRPSLLTIRSFISWPVCQMTFGVTLLSSPWVGWDSEGWRGMFSELSFSV